jgi:hypothetical protein
MSDDDVKAAALIIMWVLCMSYFIFGPQIGDFDNGVEKGKNDTVIMCVENPQQCKTIYDYLKLENTDE